MTNQMFLLLMYCITFSYLIFFISRYQACNVFNIVTDQDSLQREIVQPQDQSIDSGLGIWTKYDPSLKTGYRSNGMQYMHIFTQFNEVRSSQYLQYFIQFDPITDTLYHTIQLSLNQLEQYQFPIDGTQSAQKWVYFYIGFQKSTNIYTLFLYETNNQLEVQMGKGKGMYATVQAQEYFVLGSQLTTRHPFDSKIEYQYTTFRGKISDFYFLNGADAFYQDIPTFIASLDNLICPMPDLCPNGIQIIPLLVPLTTLTQSQIIMISTSYLSSRYTISGWARIEPLLTGESYDSVLVRATLNQNYYDNSIIGDRMFFWKYKQNIQPELNGFYISTYGYEDPSLLAYSSQPDDEWLELGSFYETAITKWHYFVFEHGLTDPVQHTKLYIYFSQDKVEKTKYFLNRQQFESKSIYVSIGGDKFNQNNLLSGQVSDFVFSYCFKVDQTYTIPCYFTCEGCSGPTANDCDDCVDPTNSNRQLLPQINQCACKENFVETPQSVGCKDSNLLFDNVIIEEFEETLICEYGEFLVQNQFCFKCPQQLQDQGFYCADCWDNPRTWYLNSVCTYDMLKYDLSTPTNFIRKTRKPMDFDFYLIDITNKQLNLCNGCLGYQTSPEQQVFQTKSLGQTVNVVCKSCFEYQDGQCVLVKSNCIECSIDVTNVRKCKECKSRSVLTDEGCQDCPSNCSNCVMKNNSIVCTICDYGYGINNGQCQQCGKFCGICKYELTYYSETYFKCQGCIDPYKYIFSMDGVSCVKQEIPNCQIGHQIRFGLIPESSLNVYFTPSEIDDTVKNRCALCENGYTNILDSPLCEQKGSTASQSIQTNGQVISLEEDSINSFFPTNSRSQIKNCLTEYKDNFYFACAKCAFGYYAQQLLGVCYQCPQNLYCRSCIQQNILKKNAWSQEIALYMNYNYLKGNIFATRATKTFSVYDYEIICTSCKSGYLLYEGTCIKGCEKGCQNCQIIDGKSECVQCPNTVQGQILSYENNNCLTCPQNCAYCRITSKSEINAVNSDFNPEYSNLIPYSYQCLKGFSNPDLYFDWNINLYIQCTMNKVCFKKAILPLKVYCSDTMYQVDLSASSDQDEFKKSNVAISEVFSLSQSPHFPQIENYNFYDQMNKKQIKQFVLQLSFEYSGGQDCIIPQQGFLNSTLKKNIFSLTNLELEINGDITKNLVIDEFADINGFQKITLNNIKFSNQFDYILKIKHRKGVEVLFNNILMENQIITDSKMAKILITNPSSLTLNSFQLLNCNIRTTLGLISYEFDYIYEQELKVNIQDFKILNSEFHETQIFLFNIYQMSQNQHIELINVQVQDSYFRKSSLISNQFILDYKISILSTILIKSLNLENINCFTGCQFIVLYDIKQLDLIDINISGCQFQNSIYMQSNVFKIQNFVLIKSILTNSQMIANQKQSNQVQIDQFIYELQNLEFSNNKYDQSSHSAFLFIQKNSHQQTIVTITNLKLSLNLLFYGNSIKDYQILAEVANFYIQAEQIFLTHVIIIRAMGFPEFSLLDSNSLSIQDVTSSLDSNYHIKTIHSSLQCIQQYLIEQILTTMMFFLNNKEVLLDKIYLDNLIIANQPIFLLKSLDRLTKQNIETITIKNSQFNRCTLIITKVAQQQSIIYIQSEQQQVISIFNSTFTNNHQHSYVSDETYKSSSTIQIISTLSSVYLNKLIFQGNIVTNSHSSNIFIQAVKVQITDSKFLNINTINYENLKQNIVWSNDGSSQVYMEHIKRILPIYSYGGCGYLNVGELTISNILVINSTSQLGGAFQIESQYLGILAIANSQFQNVQSSLDYGIISKGGALLIDGSESYLKLNISNCSFSQCYSRGNGGAILVIPSKIDSNITIDSVVVNDSFSFNSGVLQILKSTSATASVQVFLNNIAINNTLNGIQKYLGSIVKITQAELAQQGQNYLLFIQTGIVHINSLSIVSSILSGLLFLEDQSLIQITNFQVSKVQLGGQSLWKIQLKECNIQNDQLAIQSRVVLNDIRFQNITQFTPIVQNQEVNCVVANINEIQNACLLKKNPPDTLNYYFSDNMKSQIAFCHLSSLFTIQLKKQSIFQILSIRTIHQIQISNTEFKGISCANCTSGLINFTGIESAKNINIISITNLQLNDNNCGKTGCFVCEGSENRNQQIPIYTNVTSSNNRFLQIQSKEIYNLKYSIQLIKSSFTRNLANYGAGIFLISITALIDNCQFILNEASQAGGAIFYLGSAKEMLNIYNTQLTNNKAKIGGAIYIMDYFFNIPSKLDILMMGNEATSFGSNLVVHPSKLSVSLDGGHNILNTVRVMQNQTAITDLISIKPYIQNGEKNQFVMFPSGQPIASYHFYIETFKTYVSANLTLRIVPLNEENMQLKSLSNTKCLISSRIIDINDTNFKTGVFSNDNLNLKEVYFNEITQDYNFDSLIVKLDPKLRNSKILQLKFTCDSVKIPVFSSESPYLLESYFENYTLLMNVQTYNCQRGEYQKLEDGTCLVCDSSQDQFTVIAGQKCSIKDQVTTEAVTSVRLKLRPTYWRPYEISTKIEYCRNMPENCEGGWNPGNPSCFEGHIGALCEQCDIYNIEGKGAYSISTIYKCGACSGVGDNLTKVILISLWTLISIMLSVNGTLDSIDIALLAKKMKHIGVSVNARSGIGGILIKVLTNYFQILGTIATFQMQLPTALTSTVSSVGSPLEAMSYSLDCFLVTLAQRVDIEMIYFRIIWGLMMPMMYIIVFLTLYGIAALAKQARRSMSVITTTFIYMYIFLQPTLIGGFVALLSFRQISDVTWIQGNVAYKYNTPQHIKWLVGFILPSLGTIVVLIPLLMFWSLYKIRNDLEETKNRRNWGYLYNEYRQKAYFWELVKIQQKSLIIIFLTFYEDQIVIKAAMIFIIVFMYKMLSKKYQPYEISTLNEYDEESSLICSLSIVLGITIYSATLTGNQEIVWPFYIILLVINGLFIFKLGIQILFAQLENQQDKLDKLRDKVNERFPNLQYSNPFFRYLLTNRNEQSKRVKLRFKKIKEYLFKIAREIIQIKEAYELRMANENQINILSPKLYPERHEGTLELGSNGEQLIYCSQEQPQFENQASLCPSSI